MSIHQFCREIDDYVQRVRTNEYVGRRGRGRDMQKLFAIKSTRELLFCAELGRRTWAGFFLSACVSAMRFDCYLPPENEFPIFFVMLRNSPPGERCPRKIEYVKFQWIFSPSPLRSRSWIKNGRADVESSCRGNNRSREIQSNEDPDTRFARTMSKHGRGPPN